MTDPGLAERVERIEAQLAIQQLPIRYAMAVDARDIDAWVNCFRPDVNMGRHGTGRDALRRYIEPQVRRFYRSVHQICGHRIELVSAGLGHRRGLLPRRARGRRPVDRDGDLLLRRVRRVDGEWFFSRRRERHWYAADVIQTPQSAGFAGWDGSSEPALPGEFGSWARFWDGDDRAAALTKAPAGAGQ